MRLLGLLLLYVHTSRLAAVTYGPLGTVNDGSLYGDIYNWAGMIQNYIEQLAYDGIRKDYTQSLFDMAEYTFERMNGTEVVELVRRDLEVYFRNKKEAAEKLAAAAVTAYDEFFDLLERNDTDPEWVNVTRLEDLPLDIYMDSDNPKRLPQLVFTPYFKQNVSEEYSTIKTADEVPRELNETIFAVLWTKKLEKTMKENMKKDDTLRWQYFGTTAGVTRLYPGREWSSNFLGFYNDYDPRVRPWYIAATSGPKDVVIVIDCSLSMKSGEKFSIAKSVAKAIIRTLTKQDYLNVVCARASHWDEVGKWHFYESLVLSCQREKMVPATIAHRKDLMENIDQLKPGGTSELEHGFHQAFDLLQSNQRTACQSIIVFVTDGKDTDGESVRCGPGYYTRSGYVPGPVCKYNWTKVWSTLDERNLRTLPQARVFSYLIKDDGEIFPGHMACKHRGSLRKLVTGENLISQLSNYFEFLSKNAKNSRALWTAPYLDSFGLGLLVTYAVPAVSRRDNRTIGVAGVDATLEELENFFTKFQWGSVTSFLINKEGQTIFHPLLKASTKLKDDPIFIAIERLEQDKEGNPKDFIEVVRNMLNGTSGKIRIENARRGTPKGDYRAGVKYDIMPLEYHYAALEESDYAFALVLSDTDKVYRRLKEPAKPTNATSYFNLLIEYNSTVVRKKYPDVYEYLEVKSDDDKYRNLRVSYVHSSIFLAPQCHCDTNAYFFDDDLAKKTLDAHTYINKGSPDLGCQDPAGKYEKGTRSYVLVTQPVENLWKKRNFESIDQVKWTYVGMRGGVFRTYPGHRSKRLYDPTKRPWYRRTMAAPNQISISTPYMDAAGSGKIITISQAVFEGMQNMSKKQCQILMKKYKKLPGGCHCSTGDDCKSGYCYVSEAPGPDKDDPRCATERIEAITSLDIGYDSFHKELFDIMKASDGKRSCDQSYTCPDGMPGCVTKCYIVDNRANVIVASEFINATALDTGKYTGVTLGKKEGEIMKELVFTQRFFNRSESIDFQGSCSFVAGQPKVTLKGIPTTPEEQDDYYKTRGPIPSFSNSYGCIQDVVSFTANAERLGSSRMIVGNVSGPCMSGFYYLTSMPSTNLYLLVIENWRDKVTGNPFPFNCHIMRTLVKSGAYRIINGTCAHEDTSEETMAQMGRCPRLRDIEIPCEFNSGRRIVRDTFFLLVPCLLRPLLME